MKVKRLPPKYCDGSTCFVCDNPILADNINYNDSDDDDDIADYTWSDYTEHYSGKTIYHHGRCYDLMYDDYWQGVKLTDLNDMKCYKCKKYFNTAEFVLDYDGNTIDVIHKECFIKSPVDLTDEKCNICDTTYNEKTFSWTGIGKKIRHVNCIDDVCPYCTKSIGRISFIDLAKYRVHYYCADEFTMNSYDSHRLRFHSSGIVNIDKFWPDICNRDTFHKYPREFRAMAIAFLMVIRRLNLHTMVNKDLFFMILNRAIEPACYPIQNGIEIALVDCELRHLGQKSCKLCDGIINISRLDRVCTPTRCKYYSFVCLRCNEKMPHGLDLKETCTAYRCAKIKCYECGGPIRAGPLNAYDGCFLDNCLVNMFYRVVCNDCGGPIIKHPVDDTYCTTFKCRNVIGIQKGESHRSILDF